ncbi:hypothetical protein BC939DRAFT_507550 [Gamsiella multidivaricata]|uniref:uncharacterized protein n=1 Tax=Gamsiella multidivaricata TaxID=101098 RepID=UPI00221F1497|nr:uncharacterized protein BC939DRAFT_507550 [Gamsiella multidivaricata]KAG0370375.1 hypothetical protein BGZ54_006630 [Gamsiella multidivaricata]KAI7817235.1 hypothetical protein BC939DRAFT_507550 [Gamsiella multidivaricata]
MADHVLNPQPSRGPLQESRNHSNIQPSRQSLSEKLNGPLGTHADSSFKVGQENIIPLTYVSSTNFLVRKPSAGHATIVGDKGSQRNRIALQQKPFPGPNPPNLKDRHVLTQSSSNPLLKVRQLTTAPSANSTSFKDLKPEQPTQSQAARGDSVTKAGPRTQLLSLPKAASRSQTQPHPQAVPRPPQSQGPISTQPHPNSQLQSQPQVPTQPTQPTHYPHGTVEWIQSLVKVLPTFKFYFHNVDPLQVKKFAKTLAVYNATVTKFFSNDVTHIVTTSPIPNKDTIAQNKHINLKSHAQPQPPSTAPGKLPLKPSTITPSPSAENSILVKALSFGIKIWSLNRMIHIMGPLLIEPLTQNENRNLQDYLQHEKVYGLTTTQNDDAYRPEYLVLRRNYVLVEDVTGHFQTILAYDYPKDAEKPYPWPRIYVQSTHKTPFVCIDNRSKDAKDTKEVKESKDAKDAAKDAAKDTSKTNDNHNHNDYIADNKEKGSENGEGFPRNTTSRPILQRSPSASVLASGLVNSITSNIVSTSSAVNKTPAMHGIRNIQDPILEQLGKRALNAIKGEAGIVPDIKKTEFVRPANVLKLSKHSIQSNSVFSKREPLGTIDVNVAVARPGRPAIAPLVAVTSVEAPSRQSVPTQATRELHGPVNEHSLKANTVKEPSVTATVVKDYRKKGYCENCRMNFGDFDKHIASAEHRHQAQERNKFEQLDQLLHLLQRKPKKPVSQCSVHDTTQEERPSNSLLENVERAGKATGIDGDGNIIAKASRDRETNALKKASDQQEPRQSGNHASGRGTRHPSDRVVADLQCQEIARVAVKDKAKVIDAGEGGDRTSIETCVRQVKAETKIQYEHKGEDDQLSSEMLRLGVSETGEEECSTHAADTAILTPETISNTNPKSVDDTFVQTDTDHNNGFWAPFSDRVYVSEPNPTSQVATDITQPDDRFLEDSAIGSQVSEATTPICLHLPSTSVFTDGAEPAATPTKEDCASEGSSEGDKDGLEDAVKLLKSPSAGRGAFARAQGADLRRGFAFSGIETVSALGKGSLKRKLEDILAEEQAAGRKEATKGAAIDLPSSTASVMYDEMLQSRLLLQPAPRQYQHPTPLRLASLNHASQFRHPPTSPLPSSRFSSPTKFELHQGRDHTLLPSQPDRHAVDRSHSCNGTDSGSPVQIHPYYEMNGSPRGVHRSDGLPSTLPASGYSDNYSSQQLHYANRREDSVRVSTPLRQATSSFQYQYDVRNSRFGSPFALMEYPDSSSPISSMMPSGLQPPLDPNYYGSGPSSPSRSPGQRIVYRNQFSVMSHAEQERERCYQHYHGNQLPEPAGQKKLRGGSSLPDEFDEYGEGCMVFFE